jgi:enoyl-CoA hydratase/carnithine racemase
MSASTKTLMIVGGVAVVGFVAAAVAVASAKFRLSQVGSGLTPGYVGSSARGWSGRSI